MSVAVGQSVSWENLDNAGHTVSNRVTDTDPPMVGSEFRSNTLTNGGTYSFVFDTAGTFQLFCEIHPFMRATVTVQ